jgi:hypothetical protein
VKRLVLVVLVLIAGCSGGAGEKASPTTTTAAPINLSGTVTLQDSESVIDDAPVAARGLAAMTI